MFLCAHNRADYLTCKVVFSFQAGIASVVYFPINGNSAASALTISIGVFAGAFIAATTKLWFFALRYNSIPKEINPAAAPAARISMFAADAMSVEKIACCTHHAAPILKA